MPNNSAPYKIIDIPINDIIFPPTEMRSTVVLQDLDTLARSIRQCGLLNPPSVRPKDGKFELIAGYRRLKACEILNMHVMTCRVIESEDSLADLQRAHENLFREEVNPLDEGVYFKTILEKNNWTLTDLALLIHKSPAYVSRRMSLINGDKTVSEAVRDGKITISIAEELNRVENERSRQYLLTHCLNSGATSDVVRSWRIQSNLDTGRPAETERILTDIKTGEVITDEKNLQRMIDDTGPQIELTETVREFRICTGCMAKVEVKDVFTAHFCPACADVFQQAVKGGK